ncbi:MAG: YihY family inner membrane protein [Burkholderiales bacterium]
MTTSIGLLFGYLRFAWARFEHDQCMQVASSLTFTSLLGLVPLVTVVVRIASAFPAFGDFMVEVKIFILLNLVPEVAGKIITVYMTQFADNAAKLSSVGVAFLVVTALVLMYTIDRTFNRIWRVQRPRPVAQSLVLYWAVLTLGPLLIGASLSLTSWFLGQSMGWAMPTLRVTLLKFVPVLLTVLAFALLYLTVPNRYVPRTHALMGGIAAGLTFELMKYGFGIYITTVPTYTLVYGAFDSVPIFLLWVYLSWLVVLAGAVAVATLPYWRGAAWRTEQSPAQTFYRALRVLKALYGAHLSGQVLNIRRLRELVAIGYDELEEILEHLAKAHWVRRAGAEWTLLQDADHILVADVYRQFVFDDAPALQQDGDQQLGALIRDMATRQQQAMQTTLKSLYQAGS